MAAGEEEDGDQAEGGPEVAVLEHGDDIGRRDGNEGDCTQDGGGHGDDLDPVDRADDGRLGDVGGELTRDEGVDRFGGLGTVGV